MEQEILYVAAEVFYTDVSTLHIETCRQDIEVWDSMHHVALVAALEERLDIIIPFENIPDIKKLSDFLQYVPK